MCREVLPWTTVSAYSAFIPNQKGLTFFDIRNGFCNISPYIYFTSECHTEETHGGANTKLYDSAGEAANLFFSCANRVCDACEVQPNAKNSC